MWREAWEADEDLESGGTVNYGPFGLPLFSGTILSRGVDEDSGDPWYEVQPGGLSI